MSNRSRAHIQHEIDERHGKQICGHCKWHYYEEIDKGWVCVNDRSDYCTDYTEYDDWCDEWEAK